MAEYNEQCKKCFHFQVCAQVMKNQLFIREKMLKEENPKCEHFVNAADVVEVRHGKWIRPNVPNTRSYKWQCSECGQIAYWLHYGNRGNKNIICKFGYCPNCGAKMDGDTE